MVPLLSFLAELVWLYEIVIIAAVIVSWLIAFNVVNRNNQFVYSLYRALVAVTEPLLERIRAFMPDLGAVDISPIILILACELVRRVIICGNLVPLFGGTCGLGY
jgi:YggT family protein